MAKRVQIVNRTTSTIHMELRRQNADGELVPLKGADEESTKQVFRLGSSEDEGIVGAEQPELILDEEVWQRLLKQKAVAGMVKDRSIAVYPVEA